MKPLRTESELMTSREAERLATARVRAAIAAYRRAQFPLEIDALHAIPHDALGDDYRSNPEAACRKALRLTRAMRNNSRRLQAIDRLLGNHGVEAVRTHSGATGFTYSNTGDSYAATVILFASGTFRVSSWGDIVERDNGRRYA